MAKMWVVIYSTFLWYQQDARPKAYLGFCRCAQIEVSSLKFKDMGYNRADKGPLAPVVPWASGFSRSANHHRITHPRSVSPTSRRMTSYIAAKRVDLSCSDGSSRINASMADRSWSSTGDGKRIEGTVDRSVSRRRRSSSERASEPSSFDVRPLILSTRSWMQNQANDPSSGDEHEAAPLTREE